MPTVKRRPVDLIPNPANDDPHAQVFFIDSTSEIFLDYTSYLSRILFLREHIFQCSNSGKNNLTYAEALASELSEAKKMEARFQPAIRGPILRSAAFRGLFNNLIIHSLILLQRSWAVSTASSIISLNASRIVSGQARAYSLIYKAKSTLPELLTSIHPRKSSITSNNIASLMLNVSRRILLTIL